MPYHRRGHNDESPSKRKVLILDLNGLLADIRHRKDVIYKSQDFTLINNKRGIRIICNLLLLMLLEIFNTFF